MNIISEPSDKKINKVGIIVKHTIVKRELSYIKKIVEFLKKHKKEVLLDANTAPLINNQEGFSRDQLLNSCDLVLILGGDGTILKTAGCSGKKKTLILGVNFGTLGFLSEVMPKEIEATLTRIFNKDYLIDKRYLLRVTQYRKGKKINTFLAMNDAVINQGLFARLIELNIEIDQRKVASFKTDGMIISTPTGSTAHSLSAGGPIVHPSLGAMILTPICPATLSIRPIVIPHDKQVKITVITRRQESQNLGLTIDGQITIPVEFGDEIKVRKSSRQFYMVRLNGKNYYKLLREKLGWAGRHRD